MKHRREKIKKEKKKSVRRWESIDVFKKNYKNNNNDNNNNHGIIFSFITENTFMVSCKENINYNTSYLIQY